MKQQAETRSFYKCDAVNRNSEKPPVGSKTFVENQRLLKQTKIFDLLTDACEM